MAWTDERLLAEMFVMVDRYMFSTALMVPIVNLNQ